MELSKKISCVCFSILLNTTLHAQKGDSMKYRGHSNYIKVWHGASYIPSGPVTFPNANPLWKTSIEYLILDIDHLRKIQYQTIGASYERRVYKNWFGGVGYMQWKDLTRLRDKGFYYVDAEEKYKPIEVGDLIYRLSYKMADLYAFYRWKVYRNERHFINTGIGASYCWGLNNIVQAHWINWQPPMDEVVYLRSEEVSYWGVVPYFAYDFLFFKNRINIGPDIRARFYSGRSPAEYNINLHLGVNF